MSLAGRPWVIVAVGWALLALVAAAWLALDRRPPEWDHANHLERAVHCAHDVRAGDVRAILERSSFYPPLATCVAGASSAPNIVESAPLLHWAS